MPDAREVTLACELITEVERRLELEAPILRDRIAATLHYLERVERPNMHTLEHIRRFLDGSMDSNIAVFLPPEERV